MKYWFLIFNHEKSVDHNQEDFGWQNPIVHIEEGFKYVLTGNFNKLVDMNIGDMVYLYGSIKNGEKGTNGIYGIGTIDDILQGQKTGNKHAVIKLENQGTPLIPTDTYKDFLYGELVKSTFEECKYGHLKITQDQAKKIDGLLPSNLERGV